MKFKYLLKINEIKYFKNMDQFFTPIKLAKELIFKSIDFIEKNWDLALK